MAEVVRAPRRAEARRRPEHPGLRAVVARTEPLVLARERALPVVEPLAELLPEGLRRGATVGVSGPGAIALGMALVVAASQAGSWTAVVGGERFGLAAAAEFGVVLERLAVIDRPDPPVWGGVVAALVGAIDLLIVNPDHPVRVGDVRRLQARTRERGSVLVQVGEPRYWPVAHDVVLRVQASWWSGLGDGHGHLRERHVVVEASGRAAATRLRRAELALPGPSGRLERAVTRRGVVLAPVRHVRVG